MPVTGMWYKWMWAYGGDTGTSWSVQVNISPSYAAAQVHLSTADGEGLCSAGILDYRTRPTPTGSEVDHPIGWDPNFGRIPSVYDPHMTSATAELDVGAHQTGVATLDVWTFG